MCSLSASSGQRASPKGISVGHAQCPARDFVEKPNRFFDRLKWVSTFPVLTHKLALPHNDLMTLGAGGYDGDRCADLLLNEQHIVLRGLGELVPVGGAADIALPAG